MVGFEPTRAKPTAYKTVPIDLYGTPAYLLLHDDANLFVLDDFKSILSFIMAKVFLYLRCRIVSEIDAVCVLYNDSSYFN